jgi:hypothetical protein
MDETHGTETFMVRLTMAGVALLVALAATLTGCGSHPLGGDEEQARMVVQEYVARGDAAVPELRGYLDHEDPEIRYRARTALGRITGQWGSTGTGIHWKRSLEEAINPDRPILVLELFGRFDEEFC